MPSTRDTAALGINTQSMFSAAHRTLRVWRQAKQPAPKNSTALRSRTSCPLGLLCRIPHSISSVALDASSSPQTLITAVAGHSHWAQNCARLRSWVDGVARLAAFMVDIGDSLSRNTAVTPHFRFCGLKTPGYRMTTLHPMTIPGRL